jgi:hypothetical protein
MLHGTEIHAEYFNKTSRNPNRIECAKLLGKIYVRPSLFLTQLASEAKWGCLKSLGSADAQYNVESVLNWFKRARGAENRKNKTKVRGSSIAAATASQELPRNRQSSPCSVLAYLCSWKLVGSS